MAAKTKQKQPVGSSPSTLSTKNQQHRLDSKSTGGKRWHKLSEEVLDDGPLPRICAVPRDLVYEHVPVAAAAAAAAAAA